LVSDRGWLKGSRGTGGGASILDDDGLGVGLDQGLELVHLRQPAVFPFHAPQRHLGALVARDNVQLGEGRVLADDVLAGAADVGQGQVVGHDGCGGNDNIVGCEFRGVRRMELGEPLAQLEGPASRAVVELEVEVYGLGARLLDKTLQFAQGDGIDMRSWC
jgi:hypothetical protein